MKLSNLSDIRASQAWGWEPQPILDCTNVYTHTHFCTEKKKDCNFLVSLSIMFWI